MSRNKSRSSRREFLRGRSALDAVHDLTQPVEEADPADQTGRTYLVKVGRRAMACQFEVLLNAGEHDEATERALEALDLVEELEDQMSAYRQRSEISLLNAVADKRPVSVEWRLYELLKLGITLSQETGGAFDMTAGPLVKAWGFFRRDGKMPDNASIQAALDSVGSGLLELSDHQRTVKFTKPGVDINLGGIGKGYALDRCGSLLREGDVVDFLVHGGNSSILASGDRASDASEHGWVVGIRHPLRPEKRLALVALQSQAIGTSGTATQHFYFQGKRYGHVIDPRTGYPANDVLSATAVSPSAACADALSTAFYVMGIDQVADYCAQHPDVGALITCPGKRSGAIELHTFGLEDDQWTQVSD